MFRKIDMPLSKEDTQRAVSILESLQTQLDQDDICTLGQTQVDGGSHGDDLDDLRRLQSAVDMMNSPLFSAIVDIRSNQAKEQAEAKRNGTTAGTPEMKVDAHQPEAFSQVCERYGVPHSHAVNGASQSATNGAPTVADSLHIKRSTQPDCNGFSSFVLKSTFASGDHQSASWDSDLSLTDVSDLKTVDKKSVATYSQAARSKKGSWKRSYDSSSPLKSGRGKDAKHKSEKKLSLGRRKEGGKAKTSGAMVTLADLAQSVPRASTSSRGPGMESPSIGNGSVGHGNQGMWKGSMELELCDTMPSSSSRKSYDQEEESSLSELSALIDSISVQSEPLLAESGRHSSIAMTATAEDQATVIKNYDACSSESVDKIETTETSEHTLAEEGAEQDIAMATVIENRDARNGMPIASRSINTKDALEEEDGPSLAKERTTLEAKADTTCSAAVIENCDTHSISSCSEPLPPTVTVVDGVNNGDKDKSQMPKDIGEGNGECKTDITITEISLPLLTVEEEVTDKGDEDESPPPKDILFFMRDQQSQTQLKQVRQGMCGRSPRTVSLEVHDIPLVAGGGANIGIDMVGLSSTGVYVGGVSRGSSAEGKVQAGDQILEINERKIENMASFEVDMLLSDVPLGEKVQLTIQYNPSGLAEYHRLQRKRH